jgi:hypothetical protein
MRTSREGKFRLRLTIAAFLAGLTVALPFAVHAAVVGSRYKVDHQVFRDRGKPLTTSSASWRTISGLGGVRICAQAGTELSVSVNANLFGAPSRFRIIADGHEFLPGQAHFPGSPGVVSHSFTFVGFLGTPEGSDVHRVDLQWRSSGGQAVTLKSGAINLLWSRSGAAC